LLDRAAGAAAAASLLFSLILAVTQVVLRNVTQIGLPWIDHVLRHLVLYVALFGAVAAVRAGRHIRLDVMSSLFPSAGKHFVRSMDLAAAIVCGLLAVAAARFGMVEWSSAAPGARWIAALPLILPAGFAMVSLAFLFHAVAPRADTASQK
jgi:TRAP-type C4-dicarboxylate transport system permease small subunit